MESPFEVVPKTITEQSENFENPIKNVMKDKVKDALKEPVGQVSTKVEEITKPKNDSVENDEFSEEKKEEGKEKEEDYDNDIDDDSEKDEEDIKDKIIEDSIETPDVIETETIVIQKIEPDITTSSITTSSVTEVKNLAAKKEQNIEAIEKSEEEDVKELKNKTIKLREEEKETIDEKYIQTSQKVDNEAAANLEKSETSTKHQPNNNQVSNQNDIQTPIQLRSPPAQSEGTKVSDLSNNTQINQHESDVSNKQENFNNTIKDIISSIDNNLKAEENIDILKERTLELLQKQEHISREIEQQQHLARNIAKQNQLQQLFNRKNCEFQENIKPSKAYQSSESSLHGRTVAEKLDNIICSQKLATFETRESANVTKKIDLNKILTPATDTEEILPKNRKLYASSAFYSHTLHPTVEDQVELARRISHSLSDISNQQSRGQSMYVNRKKRSVRWVHEGCNQGAELFAKRRKVSEKWVVDENSTGAQSPSGLPDYHQYLQPRPSTSPSILPAYTDVAKHRVQLNLHQEQLLEKYAQPDLRVVQTPWEAALNSGSASTAFVEEDKISHYSSAPILTYSPTPKLYDASQTAPTIFDGSSKTYFADSYQKYQADAAPQQLVHHKLLQYTSSYSARELAYKPSIPQGWKAPIISLPKDLYMPKEIPLQSYGPPPALTIPLLDSTNTPSYASNKYTSCKPLKNLFVASYYPQIETTNSYRGDGTFPVSKPCQNRFSSTYGSSQVPKQQYMSPKCYQPETSSPTIPQVNLNPSPLPYDKLAKFEKKTACDFDYINSSSSCNSHLNVRCSRIRSISPATYNSYTRPYTSSTDNQYYRDTPNASTRQLSTNNQKFSGYITSNQILNMPSYNSAARGWCCSDSTSAYGYPYFQDHMLSLNKPQIDKCLSMPYTDF